MHSLQFHPAVARWFEQTFRSPTQPQARGWPAIQSGRHVLISAPTGSGKTLAAFLASLDVLFREGIEAKLGDETQIVYVSPLKALSNDVRHHAGILVSITHFGLRPRHVEQRANADRGRDPRCGG